MSPKSFSASRGSFLVAAAVATVALSGLTNTASASIIYQDNFTGSSGSPLNGTTPTTDTNRATWTADSNWSANGSVTVTSNSSQQYPSAHLPFVPSAGNVYTLSATLSPTTNWISIGFEGSSGSPWTAPSLAVYVVLTSGGYGRTIFNGGVYGSPIYSGVGKTAQVVLDTTGIDWTATTSYAGTVAYTVTYTGASGANPNPTGISMVNFNDQQASGQVGSFSLTSTSVPEPTSLGLAAVGGLGMLLLKRRRTD